MRRATIFPGLMVLTLTALGAFQVRSRFTRAQGEQPCCGQPDDTQQRQLEFAYYTLREGFISTLQLVSASPKPIDLVIAVRSLSGQTLLAPMLTIQPQEKLSIDVGTLLTQLGADILGDFAEGSVSVYFEGTIMPVVGQLTLTNPARNLSLESQMVDNTPGLGILPKRLDAAWWGVSGGRDARVMVSNTAAEVAMADVFLDVQGQRHAIAPLNFAPHETKALSVAQLLAGLELSPAQAPEGGITIIPRGAKATLIAQGKITDAARGFSTTLNFPDPSLELASALHASGVPIGTPTKDSSFAKTGTFIPHVIVRNLTALPQSVTVTIEYPGEKGPEQTVLAPIPLEPYATRDISLDVAFGQLPLPLPHCSIRIQYSGAPGTVIGGVSSIEMNGDLVIDSPVANEGNGWAGSGANPWHLDSETESILFLTNMGEKECPIGFQVRAGGVHYYLTDLVLKPRETRAIDIRKLRDAQEADFLGNKIPASATDGSVYWVRAENVPVMGRVVSLQRERGMASSYACGPCVCTTSLTSTYLIMCHTTENLLPAGTHGVTATATFRDCNGVYSYVNETTVSTWSSNNTPVATVNNTTNKGLATAVAGGSATVSASYSGYSYTYNPFVPPYCFSSPVSTSGSDTCNVTRLTCGTAAGSQSAVTRGGTAYCSLSGVPSGATTSNWSFTDGTNSVTPGTNPGTSWSGTAVQGGTVSVTVTSGSNSQSFSATLTVNARTGWAWTAVSATKVPNGSALCGNSSTITTLQSPPVASANNEAVLAKFCATVAYSFQFATVSGGPNNGYKYLTSVSTADPSNIPTTFKWLRVPDLDNTTSVFYLAQCGNYDKNTNPNGIISGPNLDAQTTRHEAGTAASHWSEYKTAQDDPSNNIGSSAEPIIGAPGATDSAFQQQVQNILNPKVSSITNAASSEAIPDPVHDAAGNFLGYVNYQPYAPCN